METSAPAVPPAAKPPGIAPDVGKWGKHTKGIGLKLLQKFGFSGRLGKEENGVSQSIEVVVRPANSGLGFGAVKEASTLKVNKKIEAEWRGVEFVDEDEERKKSEVEKMAASGGWKKGQKKTQAPKLTAEDFINKYLQEGKEGGGGGPAKQVIIDMRFKDTRIITDMTDIATESYLEAPAASAPKLGQELLYNISLLSSTEENAVAKHSRALAQEVSRARALEVDREALLGALRGEGGRAERLHKIAQILRRTEEKMGAMGAMGEKSAPGGTGTGAVTLSSVCGLVRTLHLHFPEEFQVFGLMHLLPFLLSRLLVADSWDPFRDHTILCEAHQALAPLVDYFQEQGGLAREVRGHFHQAIEARFLPAVRRAVSQWDCLEPDLCVQLMESLALVLTPTSFDQTVEMLVIPKLTQGVASWKPSHAHSDAHAYVHLWLHPWLPLLRERLSPLYPDIRRKMGTFMGTWEPGNLAHSAEALGMLSPWVGVFDASSMESLLLRAVVPRLALLLRGVVIDPAAQDIAPIEAVLAWAGVLPPLLCACLFRGEFFPRWLRVLQKWLGGGQDQEGADLEEVGAWYQGWKGLFPDSLQSHEQLLPCFDVALDMMQRAMGAMLEEDGDAIEGAGAGVMQQFEPTLRSLEILDAQALIEQSKAVQRAQRRLASMEQEEANSHRHVQGGGGGQSVSFKEVVEAFALRNNVHFAPRGRYFEGKQLWQFGSSMCYLEQSVVFVSTGKGKRSAEEQQGGAGARELLGWAPVGLEELLAMSAT
ncbi:GC-rich sequence DNA-binding factor-like protein-domain-containing protein [Ochromonadaceae sp. CCMP2298]|nr:GC-rich sequence DNA-binding factor-like protein-domain-containing protein [Ochromonadaceae sp. CCMP2298]